MKACCEFSRKIQTHQIQKKPLIVKIEAREEEKLALAKRFSIPEIHSLSCKYQFKCFHGRQIRAVGELKALITQNCVVSLEDFNVLIDESFELHFIPNDKVTAELEEIDDPDVIPYDGEEIDIGEITAEQLALFLDPYPHKENATNPLILNCNNEDNFVEKDAKENPFQALEQLKYPSLNKKK